MDVCSNPAKLASENVDKFHELAVDPSQKTCDFTGDLTVNDLGNDLSILLNLQDDKNLVSGSISVCGKSGSGKEDVYEGPHPLAISTSEKFLNKSATFPCSFNVMSPDASLTGENEGKAGCEEDDLSLELLAQDGEHNKSDSASYPRSLSLPSPSKLVSALKGSREKNGVPLTKRSVSWAPDVYDPIPTAVSHVVTNKSTRHSKKNSKNKQKGGGKASRGSRGKDKKQVRKYGGSSSRCFKSLDDNERVIDQVEHRADIVGFNIGSPDPYCGTSFLKNSVTELHFSVAEAT